ncbi:hypothetical protein BSKO_13559 [Bryopsis sp. KO-2023]|nr:hypothetical protein BSKO_13559 [Bryopsis sp. KO-2023]
MFSQVAIHCREATLRHDFKVEQALNAATQASKDLGSCLADMTTVEFKVSVNVQKRISAEERSLRHDVARFKKQTEQWEKAVGEIDVALRELGDVENLLEVMTKELGDIKKRLMQPS